MIIVIRVRAEVLRPVAVEGGAGAPPEAPLDPLGGKTREERAGRGPGLWSRVRFKPCYVLFYARAQVNILLEPPVLVTVSSSN